MYYEERNTEYDRDEAIFGPRRRRPMRGMGAGDPVGYQAPSDVSWYAGTSTQGPVPPLPGPVTTVQPAMFVPGYQPKYGTLAPFVTPKYIPPFLQVSKVKPFAPMTSARKGIRVLTNQINELEKRYPNLISIQDPRARERALQAWKQQVDDLEYRRESAVIAAEVSEGPAARLPFFERPQQEAQARTAVVTQAIVRAQQEQAGPSQAEVQEALAKARASLAAARAQEEIAAKMRAETKKALEASRAANKERDRQARKEQERQAKQEREAMKERIRLAKKEVKEPSVGEAVREFAAVAREQGGKKVSEIARETVDEYVGHWNPGGHEPGGYEQPEKKAARSMSYKQMRLNAAIQLAQSYQGDGSLDRDEAAEAQRTVANIRKETGLTPRMFDDPGITPDMTASTTMSNSAWKEMRDGVRWAEKTYKEQMIKAIRERKLNEDSVPVMKQLISEAINSSLPMGARYQAAKQFSTILSTVETGAKYAAVAALNVKRQARDIEKTATQTYEGAKALPGVAWEGIKAAPGAIKAAPGAAMEWLERKGKGWSW